MSEQVEFAVELAGAQAVFTTRAGGVSPPPYDSLNLGLLTDDEPGNVARNREILADRHGVALAYGLQVHGNAVCVVDRGNPPTADPPPNADAVATATPGLGVLVLAADCLPIAIAGGGAVAMVHAGWRGLASGVIEAAVAAVRRLGTTGAQLSAVIGPGAGACCYEVDEDLHRRFAARGEGFRSGANLDLKAVAAHQLERSGVARVDDLGLCTICSHGSTFFSHRRDGALTGRQAGLAWLT